METEVKPLPPFFIGQNIVDNRVNNFSTVKYTLLSTTLGKPDTKSIWYSREHIAKLLDEIDHAGGDGLRIFLAAYESDHPQFAGQLCLVMNPTRLNANGGHDNVIAENEPDFAERSQAAKSISLSPSDASFFNDKGLNYGSPCPPKCDR